MKLKKETLRKIVSSSRHGVLNFTRVQPHHCSARGLTPSPSCNTHPHHYRSLFTLLSIHPLASQNRREVPLRISSTLQTNNLPHHHNCIACGLTQPLLPQPIPIIYSYTSCPLFTFPLTIVAIYPGNKIRLRSSTFQTQPSFLLIPPLYLVN